MAIITNVSYDRTINSYSSPSSASKSFTKIVTTDSGNKGNVANTNYTAGSEVETFDLMSISNISIVSNSSMYSGVTQDIQNRRNIPSIEVDLQYQTSSNIAFERERNMFDSAPNTFMDKGNEGARTNNTMGETSSNIAFERERNMFASAPNTFMDRGNEGARTNNTTEGMLEPRRKFFNFGSGISDNMVVQSQENNYQSTYSVNYNSDYNQGSMKVFSSEIDPEQFNPFNR